MKIRYRVGKQEYLVNFLINGPKLNPSTVILLEVVHEETGTEVALSREREVEVIDDIVRNHSTLQHPEENTSDDDDLSIFQRSNLDAMDFYSEDGDGVSIAGDAIDFMEHRRFLKENNIEDEDYMYD